MLDYPKLSIDLPQPHLNVGPRGLELAEDSITVGQIIAVWIAVIVAIAIFVMVSIGSKGTVIQPKPPDAVVQSNQCIQELSLDHVVIDTYVRIVDFDPLNVTEQCNVRFF